MTTNRKGSVKYLFVHQSGPGQYEHIVRHLAASRQHEVVLLCDERNRAPRPPGVRTIAYPTPSPAAVETHAAARELDAAVRRAARVARVAGHLKRSGFIPDIIIGHAGWGELLDLPTVWPDVPIISYLEYFHCAEDGGFDPEFPSAR